MKKEHVYNALLTWTGNKGKGTRTYTSYERSFEAQVFEKPVIYGSSDPSFMGDRSKYNPEELFLLSITSCHMLWYLHLCSVAGITVVSYIDKPIAHMCEYADGSGKFTKATLRPEVYILEKERLALSLELHSKAHQQCFIANSCNFPIGCEPSGKIKTPHV